jgi:hypothetical protein
MIQALYWLLAIFYLWKYSVVAKEQGRGPVASLLAIALFIVGVFVIITSGYW